MKTFKILIVAIMVFVTLQTTNAQSDKSQRTTGVKIETFKVYGTCSMDKRRIEANANLVDGVESAKWDEYTQLLTLKYSIFKKDVAETVQKKIAAVGNDTEKYRADDAVYNNLPKCCHYERK